MYDLFFLSHEEPMADFHWKSLHDCYPHARHVNGIDGILNAHKHCASLSRTNNFFVVDADNELLEPEFDIRLSDYDKGYVHVWRAKNPVNGLIYGWGGIKLFPKRLLLEWKGMPLDMTTSFELKIMPNIGSITHFNTSPFSAWRSAFRECVKLSRNEDDESRARLETWCSVANGPFSEWCLKGAQMGREHGLMNKGAMDQLMLINDWKWLLNRFTEVDDG